MNDKKQELLGESFGKAGNKLRKSLLFEFAKQLHLLICFRCQKEIVMIEDFSIEHKVAWMSASHPRDSFYDLSNIAFSHLRCNSGSANRNKTLCDNGHPLAATGGTGKRFCRICRRAYLRDYMKRWRVC